MDVHSPSVDVEVPVPLVRYCSWYSCHREFIPRSRGHKYCDRHERPRNRPLAGSLAEKEILRVVQAQPGTRVSFTVSDVVTDRSIMSQVTAQAVARVLDRWVKANRAMVVGAGSGHKRYVLLEVADGERAGGSESR